MSFELWLFAVKQLAQTYEVVGRIYEQLSDEEKRKLRAEYTAQTGIQLPEDKPKIQEIKVDLNIYEPNRMAESMRCRRICYQLSQTQPDSEAYERLIHELFGSSIGVNSKIYAPFSVDLADHIKIGRKVSVMNGFTCLSSGYIMIDDQVQISVNCTLTTQVRDPYERNILHCRPITIRRNAVIEENVIIMAGVTIGRNALILPGSVVKEDVPDNAVVSGNPARIIDILDSTRIKVQL